MTKSDNIFVEVSFEVGNKVGGIYTVISSKATEMIDAYGDNYYTVGFYEQEKAQYEFIAKDAGELRPIFDVLNKKGIKCYYGLWNIPGKPRCILIDVKGFMQRSDDIKKLLWEQYRIDSINSDSWFEEPVVWSYAVGMLLEQMNHKMQKPIVAQFHEWMSGVALLYLKTKNIGIPTVFTVHATMLGRSIAGQGVNLAEMIDDGLKMKETISIDEAYRYGVPAKHLTEVECAKNCDVFTTVSATTAKEAEFILGRKPDMILPNGLDMEHFPAMEKLSYRHKIEKDRVLSFLSAYFEPYYNVNLDDPRIILISGRYEYHNKGLDVFIDALGQINDRLKEEKYEKNTFVFIAIPSDVRGEKLEVLENFSLYNELESHVDGILPELRWQLMQSLSHGEYTQESIQKYLKDQYNNRFNRLALAFRSRAGKNPPLCAHDLNYPEKEDSIIGRLRHNNLFNQADNPIKVIFYPAYLSSADRLFSIDYSSMLVASSLAVFPSYYEPWGYTPVEAVASGCIAITTDLAGFGQYMSENMDLKKDNGIKILNRRGRKYRDIVTDLGNMMYDVVTMSEHEIIDQKHNAKKLSQLVGWNILAQNYLDAHTLALQKKKKIRRKY
ncbi:MAG: glycosyltransferase [Nanohaloarchaea archaeon]|nr:glycosyltransferase [Candidatus Nanohaloarchaea archaeon]